MALLSIDATNTAHQSLLTIWDSHRVYTISGVANYWESANELSALFTDEVATLAHQWWLQCDRAYDEQIDAKAKRWIDAHPLKKPKLESTTAASASSSTSDRRIPKNKDAANITLPVTGTTAPAKPTGKLDSISDAHNVLWAWMWSCRLISAYAADYTDATEDDIPALKELWLRRFVNITLAALSAHIGAMKRWITWAAEHDFDWRQPAAAQMGKFLQKVSRGGATAAHSVSAHLTWLCKHLGLELHLQNSLVAPWTQTLNKAEPRQQTPHDIKEAVHLEGLSSSSNPYIAHIAASELLNTKATLRFAHTQRSAIVGETATHIEGYCALGKSKIDGARTGFPWWCSKLMIKHDGPSNAMLQALRAPMQVFPEQSGSEFPWLIYNVKPDRVPLDQCTSFANEKIAYGR